MVDSVTLFRRGPEILEQALQGVTKDESLFVASPGKWTIRQIVRHLADTEIVVAMRLRQMIAEERPLMVPFDQDLWAHCLVYNDYDPVDSAAKFRMLREDMAAILGRLQPAAFQRVGLHPERGIATLGEWVERFGLHVEKHAAQIRTIRDAWSAR